MSLRIIIGFIGLLGIFGLIGLITNNTILLLIITIIIFIIIPLIIINKCLVKYLITRSTISRNYLHKLSVYIYMTIHYEMNEVYEIYELNEMNRIYEIKNKINDLHKTYYKYYSYSYVINNIEKELIIFKEKDLMKLMIIDVNNQKLLLSRQELQELILMKMKGLKTDMKQYKNYLREFFKSLNEFNDIKDFNEFIYFV
jgi:hypothetical protein